MSFCDDVNVNVNLGENRRIAMSMSRVEAGATLTSGSSSFLDQDLMWPVNLRSTDAMDAGLYPSGPYPEREGESDCSFYLRTGLCRFGSTCRFNHPPNRNLALSAARMNGEFPERIGQPECQYYLKTGSCKFGATCKFHHPKDKAGIAGRVPVNILGYPLRPNESECAYYLRTGECKFGSTCKFHHPQPSTSLRGQQSLLTTSWPFSSIPSQRWQAPPSYTPLLVPQGMVSWNPYMGQVGSTEGQQKNEASYSSNVFPERSGQSECQYYMKTGDCKFGAVCRFHHPRERLMPVPDCLLSPLGLPLRPGEPLCIFYSRYGICKFGPNCKFDHPMGTFAYNASAPSSGVRRYLGSSSAYVSLSEMPAGNDNAETEG